MKLSTLLTTITTTLLATTHASTVTISTTKCLNPNYPLTEFSIDLNTANAVPVSLPTVCGLRIVSASDNINVRTIQCQAFRDAAGTKPGSVIFTFDKPAQIATNPVQEEAVKCSVVPTNPVPAQAVLRRQENSTAIATATQRVSVHLSWSSSFNVVRSTLFSTQTVSVGASAVTPSTVVQTQTVPASSAVETSLRAPSTTRLPPGTQTNVAGQKVLGVGVAGAAFAALVL